MRSPGRTSSALQGRSIVALAQVLVRDSVQKMLRQAGLLSTTLAVCMAVCIVICVEYLPAQDQKGSESTLLSRTKRIRATPSGQRKLATMMGKKARFQQLADPPAPDDDEYITFENDFKVGGGDLMVPVSMIDYENLGEGSIVDQRYPRRLPGQSQLMAEMREVFNIDGNWSWFDDFGGNWLDQHGEAGVFVHDPSHDKLRRLGVKTG